MQSAAKVGALLIVFIALVIGAYSVVGSALVGPGSDVYYATFADAGGTVVGTRVLMAGVNVGSVSQVALVSPTEAKVSLSIQKGVAIPEGSVLEIPGSLIGLGESTLAVVPPEKATEAAKPGTVFQGRKAGPLDSILPGGGKETVAELTRTMVAVRKLLEDGKLQQKMAALMDSTNKTMQSAGVLSNNASLLVSRMNAVVLANQSEIAQAIRSGAQAVADVRIVTKEFAKLAKSGTVQHNTNEIMATLNSASKKADALVGSMNELINDPKLRGPLNTALQNTADITTTGKEIATNAAAMTKDGTVVSKNAITLSNKANEIATKASEIEDQLKGVLDKVGGFFGKAPSAGSLPALSYDMDLLRTTNPNYWRTDLNFSLPLSDQFLTFGVYDAFAANKLNAQVGKPITKSMDYRYGIYASKPALGVDYKFTPRLGLRTDVWDINNPRLDLRFGYEFGNGLVGWLGMDRIFNGNSATIGVGVRK